MLRWVIYLYTYITAGLIKIIKARWIIVAILAITEVTNTRIGIWVN